MRLAGHLCLGSRDAASAAQLKRSSEILRTVCYSSGRDPVIFWGDAHCGAQKLKRKKSRLHLARKITRIPHAIVKRKSSFKGCAGISTTSILNYRRIGKRQKSRIDCELFRVLLKNRPRLRRIRTPDARAVAGWLEGGEWEQHRWYCSMAFGESDTQ